MVLDHQLLELLGRSTDPDVTARALVNAANDAGGPDNITAVVVDVHRDVRLPAYPLPQRMEDGPTYVDVLLSAQRGNSLITYLLLMIAYFTLLGVMLIPERRVLLGLTGTTLLVIVLISQRLWMARRSGTVLSRPTVSSDRPTSATPPGTLTGRDHPTPDSRH